MPWLTAVAGRYLLPAWFVVWSVGVCAVPLLFGGIGSDAEIYYRAADAWVDGQSPWNASTRWAGNTYHFYGAPPTVVLMAPFLVIPESLFVPFFVGLQACAAVIVVRQLGLRWWWLLFPPITVGVTVGNPSLTLMALLMAPSWIVKGMAPLLKAYALFPLLGERRPRPIFLALALTAASGIIGADLWSDFLAGSSVRASRLMLESQGGLSAFQFQLALPLVLIVVAILAVLRWRDAGWLAPIALWPASQIHWSTLAMPVMTLPLAFLLATNIPGMPALAVAVHTAMILRERILQRRQQTS